LEAVEPEASAAQSQSLAPVRLSICPFEHKASSGLSSPKNEKFLEKEALLELLLFCSLPTG